MSKRTNRILALPLMGVLIAAHCWQLGVGVASQSTGTSFSG